MQNIENIKNDLAIEGMDITENDVNMYRMLAENEVAMPDGCRGCICS